MNPDVLRTAHSVGSRALAWLHDSKQFGSLPHDTTIEFTDPDNVYKPLGETALAASLVLREGVAGPAELRAAQELLDFAWGQFRSGDFLFERQVRHPMLTDPLETYAHFVRGGHRNRALDEVAGHLASLRSVRAVEMMPNRRLAVANAHRVIDPGHRADWAALAADTWLGSTPEPWMVDWMTGYNLTHAVFHLTDWGARPDGLPAPVVGYLRNWLPVWADVWQEVAQWDLLGELLIVDACLDEPVCDPHSWELLARAQHQDGLLPRDGEPVADDPHRAFKDNEHTAVVAVVAGTVTLARSLGGSRAAA
ncbi:hypothetical protein GXW83_16040 [Streptacidiphilus sp. PB12-B1b]|uniref:DUF6895 family protein n=1 Tax=Streptacidiphilus sp. PB12-B1b TaxID=2705012 RepID=UPI0015F909C9|nr:hypothetical protein [Streptacidiphilus sp. PB12-B1b]QMU76989.1 hypothetical protein GXW83_16040 [Streptacidiphilus sp. PB12-B1b]